MRVAPACGMPLLDQNRPDGRWYRASSRLPIIDFICRARGPTVSVQEASLARNSILRRPQKIYETSTARLRAAVDISVMKVHIEGMRMRLDATSARDLARPSCEIVDRTTDQVIDRRGLLSKSRSAVAAAENELVLSEAIDCLRFNAPSTVTLARR